MNPTIKIHPGVKKWIVTEVEKYLQHLMKVSPLRHKMRIELCPATAVAVDYGCGFGVFVYYNRVCRIALACDWLPYRKAGIENREDARRMILKNFAHEWGHYEQFRDSCEMSDRGANRRVKRLTRGYF